MGNGRDFEGRWQFHLKQKELDGLKRLNDQTDRSFVFLGDMTDIFHGDIPFEMLHELFAVLDQLYNLVCRPSAIMGHI